MRKWILSLVFLFVAVSLLGHAGETHTYMGTVTTLHDDGSFMLKTTAGKTIHVEVAKPTKYRHASGRSARPADVSAGKRVVVTISKDGKTATMIKFAAPPKKK